MKHDYIVEGFAYRLRPVAIEDAEFIVDVRLKDADRNRYINPISPDPEEQRNWLKKYFETPGDWYFVIENLKTQQPEGLIGVYGFDPEKNMAEWGRWVIYADSLCATESAYLIYEFAFNYLKLDKLYCNTLVDNENVVSFHDSFGATRTGVVSDHACINFISCDAQVHEITAAQWPDLKARHSKMCRMIARKV